MASEDDLVHLRRCVELAHEASGAGDQPFGSLLVDADGHVLFEDRNRVNTTGDPTAHPEFAVARWAAANLTPHERAKATTYTSGEHCPMCSTAHGLAGLGRIVYVHSAEQLATWLGNPPRPVALLPINKILPTTTVEGPPTGAGSELVDEMRELHLETRERREGS